eukprot:3470807-Amphidinium_carterae.1
MLAAFQHKSQTNAKPVNFMVQLSQSCSPWKRQPAHEVRRDSMTNNVCKISRRRGCNCFVFCAAVNHCKPNASFEQKLLPSDRQTYMLQDIDLFAKLDTGQRSCQVTRKTTES